jgi:predicted CXXCH cytochrome family protein
MLQPARPASVIPAFGGSLTLHGKEYRLAREEDSYFITERYLQDTAKKRRVDYTLGSRRVQHYLSRLDDGRIVVLPPSYDVEKKEWFHNLDIVDLEETGEVKVQVWNTNCFGCHVSGEQKGFDPEQRTFDTTWTDFGTSCERCHGPGRAHATKYKVRKAGADPLPVMTATLPETAERETLIVHPRRLDPETSTTLCVQCHSLRDITQPGFAGGSNYYDYFTPLLEYAQKKNHDPAYWPNGRPRRFSNEGLAFWQSQCFFKGGATCLSCHTDVHEPNIELNDRLAAKQDGLCAGCHPQIASAGAGHSHHRAQTSETNESTVSCVACHMPRTVISLRHRMPDHTISVPAPEATRRFGIPNACNECHKDKKADWAEARLADWFPEGRPRTTIEDAITFSLGADAEPEGIGRLVRIAGDASRPPLLRANALGYLRNYPEPASTDALLSAVRSGHPALRLVALLSLADQARDPAVRGAMEAALTDTRRTVRMAAALGLLNAGLSSRPSGEFAEALASAMNDHARRALFLSEDPGAQLDLGKMFFLAGRFSNAESSVRAAMRLNPRIVGGTYFLGLATLGQGRVAEGAALLRRVDRRDPHRKDAEAVLAKLPTP